MIIIKESSFIKGGGQEAKYNHTRETLGALALDLKRVSLSYQRSSTKNAQRFSEESLKRKLELESANLKPYLRKLLDSLPETLGQKDKSRIAEDALMYSTLFQNYALKEL